jgi:GMP synthase (glutamine-hydrolysing)
MTEKILILDFGSQYTQLIARRLRELNVFCEIIPYNKFPKDDPSIKGVVLSGSPFSVLEEKALQIDLSAIVGSYPVLAVCYGAQYIAHKMGGTVARSEHREYGKAMLQAEAATDKLLGGLESESQVWMSHGDTITELPDNFEIIAHTVDIPVAAYKSKEGAFDHPIYCLQFHPEVYHSLCGKDILKNQMGF